MVNYQNGKIYRIDGGGLTYIGSTTKKYLCDRLAGHKSQFKRFLDGKCNYYTSFEIIKLDDCKIRLIESFPCDSKDELNAREGHYIRTMDCVNKNIAGRTVKEYLKQYRENNKETTKEYNKQYRENNKEKINQKRECACGGRFTTVNKTKHLKTQKHLNYLKNKI